MALSDLQVFSEWVYSSMTEVQDQQVELFNNATNGAIILTSMGHQGDFSSLAIWKKINNLVRRRNAYGSGAVAAAKLTQLVKTSVKVAAGTPPVEIDPGMFKWIQKSPEEAGAVIGQQLAGDDMADRLNTAILAYRAATSLQPEVFLDRTSTADTGATLQGLLAGAMKFGDRSQDIACWVVHSKSMGDIWGQALNNGNSLFSFDTINVVQDGFGRIIVQTDSPSLVEENGAGADTNAYYLAGLSSGAIVVENGNEFTDNIETKNGDENILRTYQAEWVWQLGLKGYSWDIAAGGHSPNQAALGAGANWKRFATSHKDLAGVLVKSK